MLLIHWIGYLEPDAFSSDHLQICARRIESNRKRGDGRLVMHPCRKHYLSPPNLGWVGNG